MRSVGVQVNRLQVEVQNLRRLSEEDRVKLSNDLQSKSEVVTELIKEVTHIPGPQLVLLGSSTLTVSVLATAGGQTQAQRSRSRQQQGRDGAQVSAQDRRHGGADGKAQGGLHLHRLMFSIHTVQLQHPPWFSSLSEPV